MNAFAIHFNFEFRSGIRDKTLLLMNYILPLGLYGLLGFLMTELNPGFTDILIPAMVLIAIMFGTIIGLPNPLLAARESGIFRSYRVSGVPALSILAIPGLTTILHSLLVAIIMVVAAPPLFGAPLPASWPGLGAFFLLAALAHTGLGTLISVVAPSIRAAVPWAQLIFVPSMMIGVMIPQDILPVALQKAAMLLPATHAMSIYQWLAGGQAVTSAAVSSIVVLVLGGALSLGLAVYLFSWDSRNTTRRGHPLLGFVAIIPYIASAVFVQV